MADRPLRRSEAATYLLEHHGLQVAKSTLAKLATLGGGPPMRYFGRIPLYEPGELDAWAAEKLAPPVRSTSERRLS